MKTKLFLPFALAATLIVSACGGSSASTNTTVGPRLKNSALPSTPTTVVPAADRTDPDRGAFQPPVSDTGQRTPSGKTASVKIASTEQTVVVPSDLCKILALECSSLNFVNVSMNGPTSFTASAEIPKSAFQLPSSNGFGFDVSNSRLTVDVAGLTATFAVEAQVSAEMFGTKIPMTLTGQYNVNDVSLALTIGNKALNYKDAFGIPGMNLMSIAAQTKLIGGVPTCCVFTVSATLPTFLKEMGVNTDSLFRVAVSAGASPPLLGMSLGSPEAGAPNIFELRNVLSAKYIAVSQSATEVTIDGVTYPQGLSLAFDGMFGKTPVTVDGNIAARGEWSLAFSVGAFEVGGFKLDETVAEIQRNDKELSLFINGGITGYGLNARLKGSFDPFGGLLIDGEASFKPGGIDLGSMKVKMAAKFTKGQVAPNVDFTGELSSPNYGVFKGTGKVGFKSYPNGIGYSVSVTGQLGIPGLPGFADVSGGLTVTNCEQLTCSSPSLLPAAYLNGSAAFYKQPKQSFSIAVNPNDWSFSETFSFSYNTPLGYYDNGFAIGVRLRGNGSITISNRGVSLGKGNMSATGSFKTPDIVIPEIRIPETRTRLFKTVCSGPWYRRRCVQEGYWSYAGGQLISPRRVIPGINLEVRAEAGIDNRGFYVEIAGSDRTRGSRLYFS